MNPKAKTIYEAFFPTNQGEEVGADLLATVEAAHVALHSPSTISEDREARVLRGLHRSLKKAHRTLGSEDHDSAFQLAAKILPFYSETDALTELRDAIGETLHLIRSAAWIERCSSTPSGRTVQDALVVLARFWDVHGDQSDDNFAKFVLKSLDVLGASRLQKEVACEMLEVPEA